MNGLVHKCLMIALASQASGVVLANGAYTDLQPEHWFEAMEIGSVDSEILFAIALTESGNSFDGMRDYGPWPWTMNINGEPKFYASRQAARKALQNEVDKGNKKVAVGMYQIYLRWNGHYAENAVDLLDPVVNLYAAAMVLRDCGSRYGTTRHVLSCYYSGDVDEAGIDYAERVLRKAKKWGKPFRLQGTKPTVRFRFDEAEAETVVERTSEIASRPTPTSMSNIAKSRSRIAIEDHDSFVSHVKTSNGPDARRVITVE